MTVLQGHHQYACASCGAALEFDPGTAGLRDSIGQEVWPALALLGLTLLGVEWWWFHFKR